MKCPYCRTVSMDVHIAVKSRSKSRSNLFETNSLAPKGVELVDIIKCPKCGHTEDIVQKQVR